MDVEKNVMEEEMEEVTQACSELPEGKYLYGYVDPIPCGRGFKTRCVGQLIIVRAQSGGKGTGWRHSFDDGGEAWKDCWRRVLGDELVLVFKMHDHVKEYTRELWARALDRLGTAISAQARAKGDDCNEADGGSDTERSDRPH
jgi:hypothetical protein